MKDWHVSAILGFIMIAGAFIVGWTSKPTPTYLFETRGTGVGIQGPMTKEQCFKLATEIYKKETAFKDANPDDKQGELQAICYQ